MQIYIFVVFMIKYRIFGLKFYWGITSQRYICVNYPTSTCFKLNMLQSRYKGVKTLVSIQLSSNWNLYGSRSIYLYTNYSAYIKTKLNNKKCTWSVQRNDYKQTARRRLCCRWDHLKTKGFFHCNAIYYFISLNK